MMEIAEGNPCVIQWLLPGPLLFVLPGKLVPRGSLVRRLVW